MTDPRETSAPRLALLRRACRLIFWLYVFMVSIKMMGAGFKTLGSQVDIRAMLTAAAATPIMGVCIGLLATAIVQSSSFTTSMLVTLVAAGSIDLRHAIPVVMGANIGTTITNSLVATAHVARRREFQLAFTAGTVHDIFNLLTVAVLMPLEWLFHPLERLATVLTDPVKALFASGEGGTMSKGPIQAAVAPVVHGVEHILERISDSPVVIGTGLLIVSMVTLFLALNRMVVVLRQVFMGGVERAFNEWLFRRWWTALLCGVVITAIVQSSSMTVSLLVPLVAGGLVSIRSAFPFTLGANIGTTITAFLAAVVAASPAGVALALAHLLFNIAGTAIFLPLRRVPIRLAEKLAGVVYHHRWVALFYIVVVFFILPIVILGICRALAQ
jgi:sodium-dependent phosphate cotransporter